MIIEVGGFLALAALIVGLFAWLRQDINRLETRMDTRFSEVETRISEVKTHMNTQSSELRERMAKLEGLRESITGRRAA